MQDLAQRIQKRVDALPRGLQSHIHRVREIAVELAQAHDLDPERSALTMLAHDVARAMADDELLRHAHDLGLPLGVIERAVPLMLHGPVGAEVLKQEDGLDDPSLYGAVYWHTTAHPSLDDLGKLVFLADKLDPRKIVYYPYLPELKKLAVEDLDQAVLEFLTRETIAKVGRGELIHPMFVEARNALLASVKTEGSPASTS